jgi:protein transport protein SEC61 subunit gamma-like protein
METEDTSSWKYKIRSFVGECVRVLKVTRKPDALEFKTIVKVSGLGILIIGLIGFIVQMAKLLFSR